MTNKLVLDLIQKAKEENATFIDLGNCGLTEIPEEILELADTIEYINLDDYYIFDTEPASKPSTNYLIENTFEGEVSSFNLLAKLTKLKKLELPSNSINFNIVKEITKLTQLTHLSIGNNNIGDEGAKEISKLTALTNLHINGNNIGDEGAKEISKLTALTHLSIVNNNIGDEGAKEISKLTALTNLRINGNNIGDEGTKQISKLIALTSLDIGGNDIRDEGAKEISKLTALTSLDIWNNNIGDEGAKEISKLIALTSLDISNNNIGDEGAKEISKLIALTSLDISNNNIGDEGAKEIIKLTALTSLDIWNSNIGVEGAKEISKLIALTHLSIGNNNIGDEGAKEISKLTALTSLNIWNNNIGVEGAKEISKLTALTGLNIEYNNLGNEGAKEISKLTALTELNIEYNNLGNEGAKEISKLTALTSLDIGGNDIRDEGAKEISKLTALTSLDISNNNIGDEGAKEISKLIALTSLDIVGNDIGVEGVKEISNLFFLKWLNIEDNNIVNAKLFKNFKNLQRLNLEGNPIKDVPESIIQQFHCLEDLRIWWEETADETKVKPNKMVKLQILGNGNAGKSSTIEALKNEICEKEFTSTHGIIIEPFHYKLADEEVVFQAWDFGGQEIYHGTHKLFIASQSIQLLIADEESELLAQKLEKVPDRQNTNELVLHQPLQHYIDMCKRQSPRSIRLVAKNKSEIKSIHLDIETTAKTSNLSCLSISAKYGNGIKELRSILAEKRNEILGFGMLMPVSWLEVQQYFLDNLLDSHKLQLISYKKFNWICKMYHVSATSEKALLEFLHHTGIIYKNEELLKDTIIIDQKWALEAIYKPLDRSSSFYDELRNDFKGRVRIKNLFKAFGEGYSINDKWLFLHFMQSCGLCFPLHQKNREKTEESYFIFPEFLSETETPAAHEIWKLAKNINEYTYTPEYLDYFFIQQFIVEIGNKTKIEYIWKTGIVVVTEKGKFRVEVLNNKVIKISIEKEITDKYLPLIVDIFEDAKHERIVTDWIDEKGEVLDLDTLRSKASKYSGIGFDSEFVNGNPNQPQEKGLKTLLPNVEQPRPIRVVISYASEDLQALEDLKETLAPFDGKIQILYDKKIINGSRTYSPQIIEMFEDADCYLILVSKKYQNKEKKDYIWKNEFPIVKKRQEQKGIHVYCLPVAPVIFNSDIEPFVSFRKGNNPLPEKGHDRENYLIAFATEIVENNILKINETK